VALSSLEQVISKYALKQDDTEEEERSKRIERDRQKKEVRDVEGETWWQFCNCHLLLSAKAFPHLL
jgi:hypothetical protein